jgi:hypothetical protein
MASRRTARSSARCATLDSVACSSLELFNREYWTTSADENAKAGIDKLRATVKKALA